jgi:hypothetical protein
LASAACLVGGARADFVGDLASCATAPIDAAIQGLDPSTAAKVAAFAVEHGECIPSVVGGDPMLYTMTGFIIALQSDGKLATSTDACIDDSIGLGSKYVADAVDQTLTAIPGGGAVLSADARALLRDIAKGKSNATLYQVPGFSYVAQSVTCGCAVASSGVPIETLKEQAKTLVKGVEGCAAVASKLIGGAYEAGKAAVETVNEAAKEIYGTLSDAANALTCSLFSWGCPKKESGPPPPPFFCVGYENLRAHNQSAESIVANYSWLWKEAGFFGASLSPFDPMTTDLGGNWIKSETAKKALDAKNNEVEARFAACEASYAAKVEAEKKRIADEQEAKRILAELEKAEKLASAYALRFAFDWIPKCRKDAECEKGVSKIADLFGADLADDETIKQYGTFKLAAAGVYKKYSSNAGVAVAFADERLKKKIRDNSRAPARERLWAFDCNPFLGRDRQSLCRDGVGFDVCKGYAKGSSWDLCVAGGAKAAYFATGGTLEKEMTAVGCIAASRSRKGATWQCLSDLARARCEAFKRGGSSVTCKHQQEALKRSLGEALKNVTVTPAEPPPAEPPATTRGTGESPASAPPPDGRSPRG